MILRAYAQQIEGNIDVGITIDGIPIEFTHNASDLDSDGWSAIDDVAEITIPAGSTWRLSYLPDGLNGSGGEPNIWRTWTLTTTPTTPVPTYALSSINSADEGNSFDVTLTTTNVSDGTSVPYTIGIQAEDISESLTGIFTVNSNTATKTFNVSGDLTTEGTETFTLTLDGLGEAVNVTINDIVGWIQIGDDIYGER